MAGHGKRYTEARTNIDREHAYTPLEAVRLPTPRFHIGSLCQNITSRTLRNETLD